MKVIPAEQDNLILYGLTSLEFQIAIRKMRRKVRRLLSSLVRKQNLLR